jgi:hypothetical protein
MKYKVQLSIVTLSCHSKVKDVHVMGEAEDHEDAEQLLGTMKTIIEKHFEEITMKNRRLAKEKDLIAERAAYNTADNKKHGSDQECDGYCATDECVCPVED